MTDKQAPHADAPQPWQYIGDSRPEEGIVVETKIDNEKGCRNVQPLKRQGNLWFVPDGAMYVYYTPTHWRPGADAPAVEDKNEMDFNCRDCGSVHRVCDKLHKREMAILAAVEDVPRDPCFYCRNAHNFGEKNCQCICHERAGEDATPRTPLHDALPELNQILRMAKENATYREIIEHVRKRVAALAASTTQKDTKEKE